MYISNRNDIIQIIFHIFLHYAKTVCLENRNNKNNNNNTATSRACVKSTYRFKIKYKWKAGLKEVHVTQFPSLSTPLLDWLECGLNGIVRQLVHRVAPLQSVCRVPFRSPPQSRRSIVDSERREGESANRFYTIPILKIKNQQQQPNFHFFT